MTRRPFQPLSRFAIALVLVFVTDSVLATDSVARTSRPVDPAVWVERFCVGCHGEETREADFRLDQMDEAGLADRRDRWHAVWKMVRSREMPPEDDVQPSDDERQALLMWIEQQYGTPADPMSVEHWSLKPPSRPQPPTSNSGGDGVDDVLQPIDAFVTAALREHGIEPSPPADRRTLLRRVTLDLTGLPPTPDEIAAFLDDPAAPEDAYDNVVDRLLGSDHYGERWAQHWLDVIRWAETVGFETNAERRDAWHYRDWVIRAFNEDMPYDAFIRAQLVGDQTGDDAALGFLVAGPANLPGQIGRDEEAMRQARQDELDEVIRTVSQSLFGLTIGCARCHDHKFDPISQQDYYSMQAVFAGLQYGTRRLRGVLNDQWTQRVPEKRGELRQAKEELESKRAQFGLRPPIDNVQSERFDPIRADAVRMEIDATTRGPASLYEFEIWDGAADANGPDADGQTEAGSKNVALKSRGGRPSASSFALANQTRHFDNLVDGSVDRRQAFPWVAEKAGPAWIQVDLPQPTRVDRVVWHSGSSVPIDYRIRVRRAGTGQWVDVAETGDRLPRVDDTRKPDDVRLKGLSHAEVADVVSLLSRIRSKEKELARLSAGPQTYAAHFIPTPEETVLLHRGDPMQPRQTVFASAPAVLADQTVAANPTEEHRRRDALAEHLTHASHPLTARVMVNRIWQHHFGTGIVETASDFGRSGRSPSNQDLLDWLAVEFVESGWSVKHLHRLIVTSKTYRQSSRPRKRPARIDADSRLLWRFPPRRLEAEAIRDSILAISGKLNRMMYGRGFDLFNQRGGLSDYRPVTEFESDGWRRMIYAHKVRMQSVDVFGTFDCPDAGQMTPRRNQSITPIQSLSLFNSPFVNRQAGFLAERIETLYGDDLEGSIEFLFECGLARRPTEAEAAAMIGLAKDHGMRQVCRVMFNTSEFVFLQ